MTNSQTTFAFLRDIIKAFETQFQYNGKTISAKKYVFNLFLTSFLLGIFAMIITFLYFAWPIYLVIPSGIVVTFLVMGIAYIILDLQAEGRGKQVEIILPDALQLIASNIKAGLTTERALVMSARPEFGPLEIELRRVSSKIYSGTPVEKAIIDIPKRVKSTVLERTTWLLARGISSGGEIADLLMQLSNNLRTQLALQSEARAAISIYLILIFFSAAFGGPALYAISTFIVEVMSAQIRAQPSIDPSAIAQAGSRFSGLGTFIGGKSNIINPNFIVFFSQIMLFVGGIFASLILGAIATGKEKNGVKYLPIVLFFSFGLFFLIRTVLHAAFGPLLLGS